MPTIKGSGSVKPRKLQIAPGLADWLSEQALQLDCDPRIIDAPPWALTRAMLLHDPALKNSTSAILDWSASDPLLVVQQGGAPQFTRRLEGAGLNQLTSKIQERLDLPLHCIMYYLSRFSSNSPLNADSIAEGKRQLDWALSLLVPGIQIIVEQLTKSFNYLQWQCKELVPKNLLLCGGGATLPILVEALSRHLNIPVQIWELQTADGHRLGPASAQAAAMSALEWMR
jgi:Tfp pilus assembly PilM family ATPase